MTTLQERIQTLLDRFVAEGTERGVQFAAYIDGHLAVDAWAGVADPADGASVDGDTLFPVFSTTKGIAATLAHMAVERGLVTYDTPIAGVWPDFGANGKQGITLRHALSHTSGLPLVPQGLGFKEMCDWDTMCAAIAELKPVWEPGSKAEYHAMTYGWIVGETIRRVDGRPFAQMMEEEIKRPLGIEALYVGIPDEVENRVAILEHPGCDIPDPNATGPESVPSWMGPLYGIMNRAEVRRACIPASNGVGSARAFARHYAALLPGGVDDVTLLPPERIRLATEPQKPNLPDAEDPKRHALGYGIAAGHQLLSSRLSAFGHGGFGGSLAFADPELRLATCFTKNLYGKGDPLPAIFSEIRAELTS